MGIDKRTIEMIKENYPTLKIDRGDNGYIVAGELFLNHLYGDVRMTGTFTIEIVISDNFPLELPCVRELSDAITPEYPHINTDGQLCLASELELKMFFSQCTDMSLFVEKYIIPYLYTYCYYKEYGVYPYGERSHGVQGNLEYLKDLFELDDWGQVFDVMVFVAESSYRGHLECPCGSGKKIRNCHGTVLRQVIGANLQYDCKNILDMIKRMYDRKAKNGKRN
ncbi:MAG: hypothetical protein IJZ23_11510 [Roseburia sp.]|nr:hypothetical protein [Roseburia sp.]